MQKAADAAVPASIQAPLLDLASAPLATLLSEPEGPERTTLNVVMKRLFDPRERDLLTVSAFGSAL
ncbi:hypothetical protein [Dactylosporangium sp. NPDC049140]|jgi:hypothetical protein|uniref:hypothetical protein n=1 Tax=Dactylosporangium sp. NPDC049140 TaxID=3155647 RepID=UPI0033FDD290